MPEDSRKPLPPVLRELRRDLSGAWLAEERRNRTRRRRRSATVGAGVVALLAATMTPSWFRDATDSLQSLSSSRALAAQGSSTLGEWSLALKHRPDALCVVLRTTGSNSVSGRVCDTAFPKRRSLTVAIARSPGGTWVYGLSTAPVRTVTVRAGGAMRVARTTPLREEALRSASASGDLRGFLVVLPGVSVGSLPSVSGRNKTGRRIAAFPQSSQHEAR